MNKVTNFLWRFFYRPGFVVLQIDRVPSGVYHIIPSTFKPGCESPFFLKVKSSCDFSMEPVLNKS